MAGTVTWESFARGAQYIRRVSDSIGDGWQSRGSWEHCDGYLAKRIILPDPGPPPLDYATEGDHTLDDDEDPVAVETSHFFVKDFHILYNVAHGVPCLYLNAHRRDGGLLPVEKLWANFTASQNLEEDSLKRLQTLTQQEHPFLGEPWYYLHPCLTSNLMATIGLSDSTPAENYIVTWMSSVLPLLGCPVAHHYAIQLPGGT